MICPDCRLHLVGHASCELAAERAADWEAIREAVSEISADQVWPAELAEDWFRITLGPPEPTPLERALDILSPHLRDLPIYHEEQP